LWVWVIIQLFVGFDTGDKVLHKAFEAFHLAGAIQLGPTVVGDPRARLLSPLLAQVDTTGQQEFEFFVVDIATHLV